ncbi:MAG: sarcosine oxidase, subunit delta [Actinomycetota bacterium]|nr:sarcosine oxidase, subunit delta [Actinomycetota bacterium]
MTIKIECPTCGLRSYAEFSFGGELRDLDAPTPNEDFVRVYLRENALGLQTERWYHGFGCRRWFQVTRDTVTNRTEG